jgi:hypothetical protein
LLEDPRLLCTANCQGKYCRGLSPDMTRIYSGWPRCDYCNLRHSYNVHRQMQRWTKYSLIRTSVY